MAIAKYIVTRVFEHEGVETQLGQELILKDSEGESLVQKGKAKLLTYLDPENEEDKKIIDSVKEKNQVKHEDIVEAEEARDVVSNDILVAKDEEELSEDIVEEEDELTEEDTEEVE